MAAAAKKLAPDDPVVLSKAKAGLSTSVDNPNEKTGFFQEAKENFFYDFYQVQHRSGLLVENIYEQPHLSRFWILRMRHGR